MTPAEYIQHHYSVDGLEVAAAGSNSLRVTTGNTVFDIGTFSMQMLQEFDASVDAHVTSTGGLELAVNWKKVEETASASASQSVAILPVVAATVAGTLGSIGLARAVMVYGNITVAL